MSQRVPVYLVDDEGLSLRRLTRRRDSRLRSLCVRAWHSQRGRANKAGMRFSSAHPPLVPSTPSPVSDSLPVDPMAEPTSIRQPLVGGAPASVSFGLVLNERYALESELGGGGMSRVFAASDIKLDRRVAIKFLGPGAHDDDELRRFEQEARAAGSLNHPNVLIVHDIGTHEGNPYIVSELLEGGTLREHLDGAPLVLEKAIDYAAQLADGLAAAHQRGIVHRDLKPENLFITRDGRLRSEERRVGKECRARRWR